MSNKKRFLIPFGILTETRKDVPGQYNFNKVISKILNALNVPFADDCCANDAANRPVRFNPANGHIEYYNYSNGTWLDTATYVVPTTTTTTSSTTTTTTVA